MEGRRRSLRGRPRRGGDPHEGWVWRRAGPCGVELAQPGQGQGAGPGQHGPLPHEALRDPDPRLLRGRDLRRRPGGRDLRAVPPLFNASRPPGEWQAYDLAFRRPRFDAEGKVLEPARLTLFHNGILVQNNEELLGQTFWLHWGAYEAHGDTAPIELQDHGHPVRFRNMWIRSLPERPAPTPEALRRAEIVKLPAETLDLLAGSYRTGSSRGPASVVITREGGHLLVKFPFLPKALVVEPTSPTEFAMTHTDGRLRFQTNDQGAVTGLIFEIGDGERPMTRMAD